MEWREVMADPLSRHSTTHRCRMLIRCLRLRKVIATRAAVNLRQLAREFGVHERTIRRDLAALRSAGERVPVVHEGEGDFTL